MSGFPCVRLPAQVPGPVASEAGLTLGALHSGNPQCAPSYLRTERSYVERGEVGKAAVAAPSLASGNKISLDSFPGPLHRPMLSSQHAMRVPFLSSPGKGRISAIQSDLLWMFPVPALFKSLCAAQFSIVLFHFVLPTASTLSFFSSYSLSSF